VVVSDDIKIHGEVQLIKQANAAATEDTKEEVVAETH
jgi:hypothetical protein